jgi:exosortase H (IPTLxxWG-CTERM-specific)
MTARKKNGKSNPGGEKKQPKEVSIKRFLITYFLLMNVFFFFYMYKPIVEKMNVGKVYNQFVVVTTAKMLTAVGLPCTYQGFVLILPALALEVKFGCNGLEAVLIYSIAVLSYPTQWKKKLVGIIAGFFIIQAANFLRMIMLVYAGVHLKRLFDYIHVYIAQGLMIALALGVFFIYLNYANTPQKAHT